MSTEYEELQAVLEHHQSALHDLSGVVGTGVGFRSPEEPGGEVVIQVFVHSKKVVDEVKERAGALVGPDRLAVIVSGHMSPLDP